MKSFLKTPRNIIIGVLVIGLGAPFLYRFGSPLAQSLGVGGIFRSEGGADLQAAREVSAVETYATPKGTDKVRFTITLDSSGAIEAVKTTDTLKGDVATDKLQVFSKELLLVIRGKKLSELTEVDRIGKSSLTTTAFNAALPDLKKQL